MIECVWMVVYYWATVSRELNDQPFSVKFSFLFCSAMMMREEGLM